jgi:hypothetical protein
MGRFFLFIGNKCGGKSVMSGANFCFAVRVRLAAKWSPEQSAWRNAAACRSRGMIGLRTKKGSVTKHFPFLMTFILPAYYCAPVIALA